MMLLAYATDLATGQSRDFALRGCVLAMRLAATAGFDVEGQRSVYHQALLRYAGCNADTHLLAAAFGDEIAMRQELAYTDMGNHHQLVEVFVRALNRLFADLPPEQLPALVEHGLSHAIHTSVPILAGHCEVAQRIGLRLGLPPELCEGLGQIYERWDGHGLPHGLKGDAVKPAVRLVTLAQDVVVLLKLRGREAMLATIAERRDGAYEAALADLFLDHADALTAGIDGEFGRTDILALEPQPAGDARCGGVRGGISRDRRHDRHAHAIHLRALAGRGDTGGSGGQAGRPDSPRSRRCAGRGSRTIWASSRCRSRPG